MLRRSRAGHPPAIASKVRRYASADARCDASLSLRRGQRRSRRATASQMCSERPPAVGSYRSAPLLIKLVDAQARGVEDVGGLCDADTTVGRDAAEEQQRVGVERRDRVGGLLGGVLKRRGECDEFGFLSEAGFAVFGDGALRACHGARSARGRCRAR